jgi:hypothetical protein
VALAMKHSVIGTRRRETRQNERDLAVGSPVALQRAQDEDEVACPSRDAGASQVYEFQSHYRPPLTSSLSLTSQNVTSNQFQNLSWYLPLRVEHFAVICVISDDRILKKLGALLKR